MHDEDDVTAEEVIKREHELLGESGKPSKKEKRVHRILRNEFDDDDGNGKSVMDYDFTRGFKKIMGGKSRG